MTSHITKAAIKQQIYIHEHELKSSQTFDQKNWAKK